MCLAESSGTMQRNIKSFAILLSVVSLGSLALAATCRAEITYIDAVWTGEGVNTTLADGGEIETTEEANSTDGLWRTRDYGNGSILEAGGVEQRPEGWEVEDAPMLVTTIGAGTHEDPYLPAGTYDIYVYYWQDEAGSPWRIEASLEKPELPKEKTSAQAEIGQGDVAAEQAEQAVEQTDIGSKQAEEDAQQAKEALLESESGEDTSLMPLYLPGMDGTIRADDTSTKFVKDPIMVDEEGRSMWEAKVGQVKLEGKTPVKVYVDSDSSLNGETRFDGNQRTWYDGVGYEKVE